jgi:1-acyl-sn-glycerol-3-phosphate acyltransferase
MIRARRVKWFNAWFCGVARSRIQNTFGEVRVRGIEAARAHAASAPLLVLSNHTSWWDPLVALHVSTHILGTAGHAMMDAKNLRRLPFFALVGAFGVDLDNPADGAAVIRYAARLLETPNNLVWVFPQGTERPITERPLGFRAGSGEVARVAKKAKVLPVGIRYEFGATERPTMWISIGEAVTAGRDVAKNRAMQEEAVTTEMDRIEKAVRGDGRDEFAMYWQKRADFVGVAMEKMLAGMTRWWVE